MSWSLLLLLVLQVLPVLLQVAEVVEDGGGGGSGGARSRWRRRLMTLISQPLTRDGAVEHTVVGALLVDCWLIWLTLPGRHDDDGVIDWILLDALGTLVIR